MADTAEPTELFCPDCESSLMFYCSICQGYKELRSSAPQEPVADDDALRAVFDAALTLCHHALDECRTDQMVLVPGDYLQALNDALTVVEEADAAEDVG